MKKTRVISAIFLAVFLCLSVSAVYAQNDQYETHAQINSVSLNGQGDYLKIEPGGLIEVEVFYEFWYPYPLPKDINEIVIGFEGTPGICLIDGILDNITGLTGVFDYGKTFGMIAPTEPGIYHFMRVRTKGYTCQDARELYEKNPSTRHIIGTVEVIEDIRQEAYAEFHYLALDGDESDIIVAPGDLIAVDVGFAYVAPTGVHKDDLVEIVVAFNDEPIGCLIGEIGAADLLGGHDYSRVFGIEAPIEPGIYYFRYGKSEGCTCEQAKQLWNIATEIGSVTVAIEKEDKKEDEKDDTWKPIYNKTTDLTPKQDNPTYYKIAFYQRENNIRIEINSSNNYIINGGSVSIAVDEDIRVNYSTGNVSGFFWGETDYREIKPNVQDFKLTLLLAGFIPGIGQTLSVIGYMEAANEENNIFDVNEEVNLAKNLRYDPGEFFELSDALNWRDIIVIPWKLPLDLNPLLRAVTAVRIECPQMEFPYTGTHNMIYRIDFNIYGGRVRHDIALPIKFASTWTTDDLPIKKPRQEW
jgi:hypothetical protein